MAPAGVDVGGVAHLDNGRKVDNDGDLRSVVCKVSDLRTARDVGTARQAS